MGWLNRLLGHTHRHEPLMWGLYEIRCATCDLWLGEDRVWTKDRTVVPRPALHPDFRHGRRFPS